MDQEDVVPAEDLAGQPACLSAQIPPILPAFFLIEASLAPFAASWSFLPCGADRFPVLAVKGLFDRGGLCRYRRFPFVGRRLRQLVHRRRRLRDQTRVFAVGGPPETRGLDLQAKQHENDDEKSDPYRQPLFLSSRDCSNRY